MVWNSATLRGLYIALGPDLVEANIYFSSSEIVFLINFCQLVAVHIEIEGVDVTGYKVFLELEVSTLLFPVSTQNSKVLSSSP